MTRQERIIQIKRDLLTHAEKRGKYITEQEAVIDAHFSPLFALVEFNSKQYKQLKEEKQKMKDEVHKQAFATTNTGALVEELHRLEREEYGR